MFPTIFALSVEKLGHETEFASSFIVMAIAGGAVLPPLMALLAERVHALHWTVLLPAACYGVCLVYGLAAPRMGHRPS